VKGEILPNGVVIRGSLWNDSGFTSSATAICIYDALFSFTGSMGTIRTNVVENFQTGEHNDVYNASAELQPGETLTNVVINSVIPQCPCINIVIPSTPTPSPTPTTTPTNTPTQTNTPTTTSTPTPSPTTPCVCESYTLTNLFFPSGIPTLFTWTNCDGTAGSQSVNNTSINICACLGSVSGTNGNFSITDNGLCNITPTPTATPTQTPSPTTPITFSSISLCTTNGVDGFASINDICSGTCTPRTVYVSQSGITTFQEAAITYGLPIYTNTTFIPANLYDGNSLWFGSTDKSEIFQVDNDGVMSLFGSCP
jgi:hypothetical protein